MKKRPSGSMREIRAVPSEDRPTMFTCESCAGLGRVEAYAGGGGAYRMVPCQWCDAVGYCNASRLSAYRRWKRIKSHNASRGLCG